MWRPLLALTLASTTLGCQLGYYMHSAVHQSLLIHNAQSIEKILRHSDLNDEQKAKLRLVLAVKAFGEHELGLKRSKNYTTYVQLHEPYVTYIVQAAYAEELKSYLWKFPFVGEVPYKGYFKKALAEEEAASFDKEKFDTYVRGVSAYSTLGWFQDSVLSSMLRYDDYELAEVILHETIHTTLFIKSAAEFNERMANFMGQEGMKIFFRKRDGEHSPVFAKTEADSRERKLFSKFITTELQDLKKWYEVNKGHLTTEAKTERLTQIQARFTAELKPKMQPGSYHEFERRPLNNAILLAYQTYEYSLDDFQKLFDHFQRDFPRTMAYLKTLERDTHPAQTLKAFVSSFPPE